MNQSPRTFFYFIAITFVILAGRQAVFASSFLLEFAPTGTRMQSNMVLAYNDSGGLYSESLDDSGVIPVDPHVAPEFHALSTPADLFPPSSSEPLDFISGGVDLELGLAHPVPGANQDNDRILFITRGDLGAVDASAHTGPLTGHVHSYAKVELPVQITGGAEKDDPVGLLVVPAMDLGPGNFEAEFRIGHYLYYDNGVIVGTVTYIRKVPHIGFTYSLVAGTEYWIEFEYEANALAGDAFSFDFSMEATLVNTWVIPEPATIGPMMIGLVCLSLARRRRAFLINCRDSIPGGTR